jgi:hypothetical protein
LADFTEQARTLMAARGYSVRRLAREIPCDPSDLSKVLRGLKSPSPLIRQRMDVILGAGGTIRDSEARSASRPGVLRRRMTGADADAVLASLAAFRGIDNVNGGGHAHSLAAAYLDRSVTPMLREGSYSEADGRALFGAAAQVAHLAAWSAYDNGDARNAEKYLARALELAAAGGDGAFTGEVLAARSHRAVHLGLPGRAVELARAARHAAGEAGVPVLAAEAWELEANGLALTGDRKACALALAECERQFARADASSTPSWLSYFDAAYLAARVAHTLRDLGDWEAARDHAVLASALAPGMARARVFNMLVLASAWVADDRDAAIGAGREALALTGGMQSGRVAVYARDLRRRLRRRHGSGDAAVAEFDEECRELLGS